MNFATRIKELTKAIFAFMFVFLLFEGGARIAKTIYDDYIVARESWYIYSNDLGWERRPNFSGNVFGVRRDFDSQGFVSSDTQQVASTGKTKVVVIGDSTTFGYRVDTASTFVELLDNLLPDMDFINLGVPGYTSYQGYKTLLKYGLKLDPSIVIVSFNFKI